MQKNKLSKKHGLFGKTFGVIFVCVVLLVIPYFFKEQLLGKLEHKPVILLFVGDIMLSRQIESILYKEEDPLYPFLRIADVTQAPDITFGNLETSVSRKGENVGSIYSFRADPDFLKGPAYAGFDVLSVANNHTLDWGPDAFLDTLRAVKENGMLPVGGGTNLVEARRPTVVERKGTKFAFLAYSQFASQYPGEGVPAIAPLDISLMKTDIAKAKVGGFVVVVSLHWGTEYATTSSLEQKEIAHVLIDTGALIVVGHHPHVIEELESYHGGLIAYSLGNFVFDQNFSADTRVGMMLNVTVAKGRITNYEPVRIHFTKQFQPFVPK